MTCHLNCHTARAAISATKVIASTIATVATRWLDLIVLPIFITDIHNDNRNDNRNDKRNDRGPRQDNKGPRPPRDGQRDNRNDQRADRPDQRAQGPNRNGPKSHPPRKPHHKNGQDAAANGSGPRRPNNNRPQSARPAGGRPSQRPAAPPKTVMKKVSGFFKKLLGG